MATINEERITALIINCGYERSEDVKDAVVVRGISGNHSFGFHPVRLGEAKAEIEEALNSLAYNFFREDGWPYDLGCLQADGSAWTDNLKLVELLFVVGQAVGKVKPVEPDEGDEVPRFMIVP